MKILYFSGTGNSYFIAEKLARECDTEKPVSILNHPALEREIVLVVPLYHYGLPPVVIDFLEQSLIPRGTEVVLIITAEYPDGNAIAQIRDICSRKDLALKGAAYLRMPTNYIISSKIPDLRKSEELLTRAEEKIRSLAKNVNEGTLGIQKESRIYSILLRTSHSRQKYEERYGRYDKAFTVDNRCTGCGLCAESCPAGDIRMEDGPRWEGRCLSCLRCINVCPVGAIAYDGKTDGKRQYVNRRVGPLKQI